MIDGHQLANRYGAAVAVEGLSFTAQPSRVTGFLGPNGAGKSTTMRVILGLHAPSAGRATIGGRPYARLRRPLHQVGALLDAGAAHGGRTVRNTGWPSPPATGSAPAASTRCSAWSAWTAPPTGGCAGSPWA